LNKNQACVFDDALPGTEKDRLNSMVRSGNDDNPVLAPLIHHDGRNSSRVINRTYCCSTNTIAAKLFTERSAKLIVADAADHFHWITKTSDTDRLVCTLSAGMHGEGSSHQCFAWLRNTRRSQDKIHIDTADNNYGSLHFSPSSEDYIAYRRMNTGKTTFEKSLALQKRTGLVRELQV
jgi:hypothetical protein